MFPGHPISQIKEALDELQFVADNFHINGNVCR